ncbi:hypothetical protein GGR56DRAFT_525366 [Xylariaceae sp. FL0804]|nr:hypothetical protein GGR56DRAFT_525366 [Xylariaceae sp. FL0804]
MAAGPSNRSEPPARSVRGRRGPQLSLLCSSPRTTARVERWFPLPPTSHWWWWCCYCCLAVTHEFRVTVSQRRACGRRYREESRRHMPRSSMAPLSPSLPRSLCPECWAPPYEARTCAVIRVVWGLSGRRPIRLPTGHLSCERTAVIADGDGGLAANRGPQRTLALLIDFWWRGGVLHPPATRCHGCVHRCLHDAGLPPMATGTPVVRRPISVRIVSS